MDAKQQGFRRARSPERKAQRRAALIEATGRLLDEAGAEGIAGVSLGAIAKAVGLSKSNVYTYFESREHILLEVLYDEWSSWMEQTELALAPLVGKNDPGSVAEVLTSGFLARPRLCELASVVSAVLENNVSEDAIADFKTRTLGISVRAAAILHAVLPSLTFEACGWLMKPIFALLSGLWPLAHPPPAAARVMARPEFAAHCIDLEGDLRRSLTAVLRGAVAGAAEP